jgi:uncharacterized membrane protein
MKKMGLMIVLLLFCTNIYSSEFSNLNVNLSSPRNIRSNGIETFELRLNNRGDTALYNINFTIIYNDDLEISLSKMQINTLEPRENIILYMEIINNNRYIFDKETLISVRISNEEHENNYRYRFTIKPIENFWLFVILSLTLTIVFIFITIYIKINKGEKNAG